MKKFRVAEYGDLVVVERLWFRYFWIMETVWEEDLDDIIFGGYVCPRQFKTVDEANRWIDEQNDQATKIRRADQRTDSTRQS